MVKSQRLSAAWPGLSCCSMTLIRALSILLFILISSVTARADQEELPRILLIGDSISIGYTPFVSKMYEGRAEVSRNLGNAQHTGTGLEKLDEWLGDGNWDLIHFNWGLHDLCYRHPDSPNQGRRDKERGFLTTTLEHYETNLDTLVQRLKQTGARLVWANTSYVPEGELGRKKGDELRYNAVAEKVMKRYGVPTNDIRSLTASFPANRFRAPGDVHYTKEGSQAIGLQVADAIDRAMPELAFKVGMIGLDTSHVTAFTSRFNDPDHASHVPGARVVGAYRGGSPDIPSSVDRIDGFTQYLGE